MGSRSDMKELLPEDLYVDVLPVETREVFVAFTTFEFLRGSSWYLAGGTALALQVGHRQSVDLGFFSTEKDFDIQQLERALLSYGDWITTQANRGTLYGLFGGAKVSFIAYPFFRPSLSGIQCGAIWILAPEDIAVMKIIAISQRGKKRDFIDLYWYITKHKASLRDTILRAQDQYPGKDHSVPHFLKSLVYFDDAEEDPMPNLNFKADWKEIKAFFRREVTSATKELLKIE